VIISLNSEYLLRSNKINYIGILKESEASFHGLGSALLHKMKNEEAFFFEFDINAQKYLYFS
jgi:hypothetical protein